MEINVTTNCNMSATNTVLHFCEVSFYLLVLAVAFLKPVVLMLIVSNSKLNFQKNVAMIEELQILNSVAKSKAI